MNKEIGYIAFEFARRKLRFHRDCSWKDIKLFGLFNWSDVSKYLVGNPAKIKSWKDGLITTTYNKSNKIIWCQPTEKMWDKYIAPILQKIADKPIEEQIKYIEDKMEIGDYTI